MKNLELRFCENLHAKCYFNENLMVLTSMNLHQFSQSNNREMGVLIKCEDKNDEELFLNAKKEANLIINASIKIDTLNSKGRDEENEAEVVLNAVEQKLYKGLKSFRFKVSEKDNIPAYMVFRDIELKNIAIQQPKTKEELLNIKGIAIKKYEKYGVDVLKLVNQFRD